MTVYQPVGCALIEQLELACLQRQEVTLILHDQAVHMGGSWMSKPAPTRVSGCGCHVPVSRLRWSFASTP